MNKPDWTYGHREVRLLSWLFHRSPLGCRYSCLRNNLGHCSLYMEPTKKQMGKSLRFPSDIVPGPLVLTKRFLLSKTELTLLSQSMNRKQACERWLAPKGVTSFSAWSSCCLVFFVCLLFICLFVLVESLYSSTGCNTTMTIFFPWPPMC